MDWAWDPSLYEGSARHYAVGRMAYPAALADTLRDALGLDGTGRLLDVGCGPGSLTLLLAPLVASAVGVDADPGMIAEARRSGAAGHRVATAARRGAARGPRHVPAGHVRAVVPLDGSAAGRPGGPPDDRARWRLGARLRDDAPRGRRATTRCRTRDRRGTRSTRWSPAYLGPVRRAGQGSLPTGTRGGEEDVMRDAGYRGPERLEVVRGDVVERSTEQVVSAVFSLSSSAPHLFGDPAARVRRRPARGSCDRRPRTARSPSGRATSAS